jgi:2-hydroxy-3-oxopropionate reductase
MEALVNSGRGGLDCATLGALVAELSGLPPRAT